MPQLCSTSQAEFDEIASGSAIFAFGLRFTSPRPVASSVPGSLQAFVLGSISSTVNTPATYTPLHL